MHISLNFLVYCVLGACVTSALHLAPRDQVDDFLEQVKAKITSGCLPKMLCDARDSPSEISHIVDKGCLASRADLLEIRELFKGLEIEEREVLLGKLRDLVSEAISRSDDICSLSDDENRQFLCELSAQVGDDICKE